ncbi:hypothetical protein [Paraburkholderia sp. DHOC27]|uniref:hypothetical protein n=1 Tax=Paraburkholderia sp. DHOC27 TaxID=2303330 RepID=UPI000E3ED75F|nr:hypothetical protein [Paraburkholderia sp. DHOC27]RFU47965.1 hypothetical protein D0B32_10595 [Paraburkholderia sp. DHOC27]
MDRRTFVQTFVASGACLSAGGFLLPGISHALEARTTIAVIDTSLASHRAFADYVLQRDLPCFETGADIGALWYTTLAPRLAAAPVALIGFTRASDHFVLSQLAARTHRVIQQTRHPDHAFDAAITFLIEPVT